MYFTNYQLWAMSQIIEHYNIDIIKLITFVDVARTWFKNMQKSRKKTLPLVIVLTRE